jgi:hypothetical protein
VPALDPGKHEIHGFRTGHLTLGVPSHTVADDIQTELIVAKVGVFIMRAPAADVRLT